MDKTDGKISLKERLSSMILDQASITLIALLVNAPFSIYYRIQHPPIIGEKYFGFSDTALNFYLTTFTISLYLNKDCYLGRSVGKNILKLQVVDNKFGEPASPFYSLIRNLTIIIWPVEAIFALFNHERRIGDFIAGTKLVRFNQQEHDIKPNWVAIVTSVMIGWFLIGFVYGIFNQ